MFQRTARRAVAVGAAIGLAAAGLTVLSAPAFAAGSATIQINTTGNIGTGQTISVQGNAGGPSAPALYVAVCETTPTASNCDQSLTGFGTPTAHIQQVTPDPTTGAWGPVNFFVRTTIITGNTPGGFNCITAGTCIIGTTNSMNPADHTYDSTTPLAPLGPTVSITPNGGLSGDVVSLTGSGFPAANTTTGAVLNTTLNVGQCGFPPTATSCDGNLGDYAQATVDANGHVAATNVTLHFPFTDFGSTSRTCLVANSCIVGTSNAGNNADQTNTAGAFVQNLTPQPGVTISGISNQTGTSAARPGDVITAAGAHWTPSGAVTAALCDTTGANCDATGLTGSTLAVDTSGNLSGTATVDSSATTGARTLLITQGANSALTNLTILGAPTLSVNPGSGGVGATIQVAGSNWNPGSSVTISEVGPAIPNTVTVTADSGGAITGTVVVSSASTTAISATAGALSTSVPFSTSALTCNVPTGGNCALQQNVVLVLTGGQLSQTLSGSTVTMPPLTLTGAAQVSNGSLNTDTVVDARGGQAGWTLNARMTDLTNGATPTPNGTITAGSVSWTPSCATTAGTATVTAGTTTHLSTSDQLFCQTASGQPGGTFTADSPLSVPVAATQDAGTYNAIVTLTLS